MSKKTKKSYSAKLKFQIVLEVLTCEKEDAEIARVASQAGLWWLFKD